MNIYTTNTFFYK